MKNQETEAQRTKRLAWKARHSHSAKVTQWIVDNPAPKEWEGDALDWAYLEMPFSAFL